MQRRLLNIIKHCVEDAVASASGASRQWNVGGKIHVFSGSYDAASPPGGAKSGSRLRSLSQQNKIPAEFQQKTNDGQKCCKKMLHGCRQNSVVEKEGLTGRMQPKLYFFGIECFPHEKVQTSDFSTKSTRM
jgi:hypothetical protein